MPRRFQPEQAATLKRLAEAAYELEAFQRNLTRGEADLRIAMLAAKLKLLDGPPHTRDPTVLYMLRSPKACEGGSTTGLSATGAQFRLLRFLCRCWREPTPN